MRSRDSIGPRGPRGRGRRLIQPLKVLTALTAVLAAASGVWAMGGSIATGICIVAPAARVAYLVVRWLQIGDVRYARWGVVLLLVMASAPVIGRLT